jgi:hypothetical protein
MGIPLRRLCLAIVVACIAFLAVRAVHRPWPPEWSMARRTDNSFTDFPTPPRLERKLMLMKMRITARQTIAKALIRGELTLWEAAALFRRLDAFRDADLGPSSRHVPGNSTEERLCRQVIQYARHELEDDPQQDCFVSCLEYELEEQQAQGKLPLPDPPTGLAGKVLPPWH